MAKKQKKQLPKLQDALVLFYYMLSLFGYRDLDSIGGDLKDPSLEGMDDDEISRICYVLKAHLRAGSSVTEEQLFEYDRHIVQHTKEINVHRKDRITWKYYQYLALLFTEAYLDRFFSDRDELLADINRFLIEDFNSRPTTWHDIPAFTEMNLNKLAFWCATGSGKTLLMHINIKQYLFYAGKNNAKRLNRILILTPNEGLSSQHIAELRDSGFYAELFNKSGQGGFFSGEKAVEIIDMYKLAETDGDKTVSVDSFEGNNLVLVDEGHRGSGGDVWRVYRNKLTREGFSFEYSATLGQAIASRTGPNRFALLEEYGKATLFDYSYRYFYKDGFGKDYRIMNMASWDDEEMLNMYLTAYLLCLYEQMLVYDSSPSVKNRFLIARPLGIFVGGSVNAVQTVRGRDVSDVTQILLFIQSFVDNPDEYIGYIRRLLNPDDGIRNSNGYSLFANSFVLVKNGWNISEEDAFARQTYHKVLGELFHNDIPNARLHIDRQKGGDEEIGLRIGNADYFGVINVGDSSKLLSLCEDSGLLCETKEFGTLSLFSGINEESSTVNLLIGSKKFNEGWSSWRVSVMGLMNVGRSEGSEIIQLFGRGVRLKGFDYSLKRSAGLDRFYKTGIIPRGLRDLETLNIFGVRADYMDAFRKYLEEEGLPSNEDVYVPIHIPTVNLLGKSKLKVVRLKNGYDFKKTVSVNPLDMSDSICVRLDRTPRVVSRSSGGVREETSVAVAAGVLDENHLALIDWNKVFFVLQKMKSDRNWWNLELNVEMLRTLMGNPQWYRLTIQNADLEFRDFGRDVARWEGIVISLLRSYIDRAYKLSKGRWESHYMETACLDSRDPNFFDEYYVQVRKDKEEWIEKLLELREQIMSGKLAQDFSILGSEIKAFVFDRHLYYPLLELRDTDMNGRKLFHDVDTDEPLIKISPVALNKGESSFVEDIRRYYVLHKGDMLADKEVYLLRNESRRGIGFFEANNFYPDFILWVNDGGKQHVTFIDPKGIRNLNGLTDSKIQLYNSLRTEVESHLDDSDIILDSYIISNTDYDDVRFWGEKKDFLSNHVVFQKDNNYLDAIFKNAIDALAHH